MNPEVNMYTSIIKENLTYGQAMDECIHNGKKVTRAIWGGYWMMKKVKCFSNPFLVAELKNNGGQFPATPYLADMTATDWMIVE